jgi:hypothetical protein
MAKFLSFKRADQSVALLDSVQGAVTALGGPLLTAQVSNAFPGRTQNVVLTYLGNTYALYLDNAGAVRLAKYDGANWPNHAPFTALTTGVGTVVPIGTQVVRDRSVCLAAFANTGGSDRVVAVRSDPSDDAAFSSASFTFPAQPTVSQGGHSITWKNAVFIATAAGIVYYDPATNTFAAAVDTGSDADITGAKVTFGMFARYRGDLYFVLPTVSALQAPKLYKLDPSWSLASPTTPPAWEKVTVTMPPAGPLFIGPDTGSYALFVSGRDELIAWYSGNDRTRVVSFAPTTTGLVSTDITNTTLDVPVRSIVNAGWVFVSDDRRRSNESYVIVGRDIAASPQRLHVFSWPGSGQATLVTTHISLDLMLSNDERSDFRLFTDTQPSVFVTAFSQPFPGRIQLDYTLRDTGSRLVDVFGEYSIDKQTWSPMSHGDGDDGDTSLVTSPAGEAYTYYWDAWQDLAGDYDHVDVRIVARISGV